MSDTAPPLPPAASDRRLSAIVFTDVVGYSARMQRDEEGTMALVRSDFFRMKKLAERQGGEVLNTMGDGMLLGFASAVQAAAFALTIQAQFAQRRATQAPEQALEHRIGLHIGEIFRQEGRVAGDGVNIAARLQTKAQPGGICVSQAVYDLIKGKVAMEAEALGPQAFKNIADEIFVHHLTPSAGGKLRLVIARQPGRRWVLMAALAAVVLMGAVGVWKWPFRAGAGMTNEKGKAVIAETLPPVSDKSIAVLPFANMSDDKENAFFTDGIHEDILTHLANLGELKVISRTSVMQYRDTTKPIRQIGRELGVAYILEGSVRRVGKMVRVTGQLINARTEGHVWSKYYDKDMSDVFAIQSALATEIATALRAVISPQEQARLARAPTDNPAAYELLLKARDLFNREGQNRRTLPHAEALLQSAVELDPQFATAWGDLALIHLAIYNRSYDATEARMAKARQAVETMERLAPDEPDTWLTLSRYFLHLGDFPRSDSYLQRAARALPNNSDVVRRLTEMDKRQGRWSEALAHYRQAFLLDPQNPGSRRALGAWLTALRHYDEAVAFAQEHLPSDGYLLATLAFYQRGSTEELEAWIADQAKTDSESVLAAVALLGSAADYVKLADEARGEAPNGLLSVRTESTYAAALMALGETKRARAVAIQNLTRIRAAANTSPAPFVVAQNLALLGDKQAALAALDADQAKYLKDGVNADFLPNAWVKAFILVDLEKKEKVLAEFARLLKVPSGLNVHVIRRAWGCRKLQGDPAFEALLNDPANNAPIP